MSAWNQHCLLRRWLAATFFAVVGYLPASAQGPVIKHGSCPSGYYQSGNYCTPSNPRQAPALPKVGSCPSGYHQSGDYCLGNSSNAKAAVAKNGSCPSGYHQSGDYCLEN
jgi:hypothetical protein